MHFRPLQVHFRHFQMRFKHFQMFSSISRCFQGVIDDLAFNRDRSVLQGLIFTL